jgi:parvulin-like peptidyl-prolyl isomerase
MKQFLKEPLLHFMLIGAGLFGLYSLVNSEEEYSAERIVITEGRIEQFISVYEKTWQRQPSEQELKSLIDDYVLEEIYYRQAQEMGIDQDDTIIRRRMRQKLEFLTDDMLLQLDVDDKELAKFLSENPKLFQKGMNYSFEHIYINPEKHGDQLESYLTEAAEKIAAGEDVQSDSYFVPRAHSEVEKGKVRRDFGEEFSAQLDKLSIGKWSEPVASSLGVHFVKVIERKEAQVPELAEVREQVKREWLHHEKLERRRAFNEKFLERYEVVIEWPKQEKDA